MTHTYYTYLVSNKNNKALYTGMTNDIRRRVWEHKFEKGSKFTSKYNCNKLVYFEEFDSPLEAIEREKQLKAGSRAKKEALISKSNAEWLDLSAGWFD
ncbi:MAG TPA: GIY-YIG nuclease family protein [Pelobium sp.]|nr:GIY-YIG nuclease family protein [Pelobium sp.]